MGEREPVTQQLEKEGIAEVEKTLAGSLGLADHLAGVSEKSQELMVHLMAETAVEVAEILEVDIPHIVVNRDLIGSKTPFQHIPADGGEPARIEANPAFLDFRGTMLDRERISPFLRSVMENSLRMSLAHEFWHLKRAGDDDQEERGVGAARKIRAFSELSRAEAMIIWNADTEEEEADMFALSYIQSRKEPDFQTRMGIFVVEIDGWKDQVVHRVSRGIKPILDKKHEFLKRDPRYKKISRDQLN